MKLYRLPYGTVHVKFDRCMFQGNEEKLQNILMKETLTAVEFRDCHFSLTSVDTFLGETSLLEMKVSDCVFLQGECKNLLADFQQLKKLSILNCGLSIEDLEFLFESNAEFNPRFPVKDNAITNGGTII